MLISLKNLLKINLVLSFISHCHAIIVYILCSSEKRSIYRYCLWIIFFLSSLFLPVIITLFSSTTITGLAYLLAGVTLTCSVSVAEATLQVSVADISATLTCSVADSKATLLVSVAFLTTNTATTPLTGNLVSVSCTLGSTTNATFFFSKSCSVSCQNLALTVALM